VKNRYNDIERQNVLVNLSETSSLTPYRELKFSWGTICISNGVGGKKEVKECGH
jgi:hypothetical protein